jgi:uncharacterized protein
MLPEVEEALLRFVSERLSDSAPISLTWYGGEPLLAKEVVIRVSGAICAMAKEKHCAFTNHLVTNGTMLTPDILSSLEAFGPLDVQVTLDGPRQVTDHRKPFADGTGSTYDAIMNNLKALKPSRARIAIRCNIDRNNAEAFDDLLPELGRLNLPGLVAYAAPVIAWTGPGCPDIDERCFTDEHFLPIRRRFYSVAERFGIKAKERPRPRSNHCMADNASGFVVGPDGTLYKCWTYVGDERWAVGNLLSGSPVAVPTAFELLYYDPTREAQCRDCALLPICMGGCPAMSANLGKRSCHPAKHNLPDMLLDWARDWRAQLDVGRGAS